jgi:hypothetical protein
VSVPWPGTTISEGHGEHGQDEGARGAVPQARTAGIYVRHSNSCTAAFDKRRCTCTPSWRGRRRSPVTGKPEWSKVTEDRSEILTWLGAAEKAKPAIDKRAQEGQTFASLSDEWMDGVERSPRSPNSSLSTRRSSSSDETDTEPNAS